MITLSNIAVVNQHDIQIIANNPAIAKNLRDVFPSPYTAEDAANFLEMASKGVLGYVFAIFADTTFIGVGSIIPQKDVHRINGEIGYWLGEPYWGKGYASEAVKLMVKFAFGELDLHRLFAKVFEYNTSSMKVLEKCGFTREAIIHSSLIKDGKIFDEHLYSIRRYE